jgi:hypothetical protein
LDNPTGCRLNIFMNYSTIQSFGVIELRSGFLRFSKNSTALLIFGNTLSAYAAKLE